jgi:hypothetical protein
MRIEFEVNGSIEKVVQIIDAERKKQMKEQQ